MDKRTSLFILNMLPQIGPGRKRLLTEYFGSPEAALAAPMDELCKIQGIGCKLAPIIHNWRQYCNPEEEQRLARQAGVILVMEEDEVYPPLLREIHDPPICLYVRGDLSVLRESGNSIAIVGSRNATNYGLRMAANLAFAACAAGWPVISGLARGIDTSAHDATLRGGGRTIAVVGSGLGRIYPPENIPLAAQISMRGGAVVSEFPMMYAPDRRSFPMRNRIISGISQGTIVVEAGAKSGSLITAATAMEQNRTVFAVPGLADAPFARGCHALIRDGAVLIENFQDVVDEFTGLPGLEPPPKVSQAKPPAAIDVSKLHLSALEQKIWNIIRQGQCDIDAILDTADEDSACVSAALLALELKRIIRQQPGRKIKVLVDL